MKKTIFGIIAILAIGCTTAPTDVLQSNALPKTPDADQASRVMGPHGCGPLGNAKVEQYSDDARIIETIGCMARAVPLNDKWHDTIYVNVCDMYWPEDEALPDLSPGATIHICAMRYVKEDERGHELESKTPWEYVLWYSIPGPLAATDKKFDIKLESAKSLVAPIDSITFR